MWSETYITRILSAFFVLAFIMFLNVFSFAQDSSKSLFNASFVKPIIIQKTGELSFNVVRVQNNSDSVLHILPILNMPKGWAMYSNSFVDTVVFPHSTISFPFRLLAPEKAKSDIEHVIYFKAFSAKKNILIESSFVVKLEVFHKWDVITPKTRVFFYPRMNLAKFDIVVVNNGNSTEIITLDIKPDNKIVLEGPGDFDFKQEISLASNSDTTLKFKATYVYSEDRVFDVSKVQIHASANDKMIYRAVLIEKYSDTYAPFDIDRNLSHEAELGIRTFSKNSKILPFIKTRGKAVFKNESSFRYNLNYYNLTETENIIGNSYYNFLYTLSNFKVGVGAFSSQLGRNLYSRNGIMVSDLIKLTRTSSFEGYASYSFLSPKTSFAAAYHFNKENINLLGSVSYDIDGINKVNTSSAVINTGRITVAKNHQISAILYGYKEDHFLTNNYQLMGFAWDINYYGKITPNLSVQITNNFGSPNIPGPKMGLLNLFAKWKYNFSNIKDYISGSYYYSSRKYHYMSYEGYALPQIKLNDQYANIFFHSNSKKKIRWNVGPSVEFYYALRPVANQDEPASYRIKKYRLEYKGFFGHHLMLSIKNGIGEMHSDEAITQDKSLYDLHVLGTYNNHGYGVRLSYDYGPMVNIGLYQYSLDAGTNSVNIAPYLIKNYFDGRVSMSLFTNLNYRFDLKYGSINVNPKIETYIFKDWYAVIGGTYSYTQQSYKAFDSHNSFYYLEFSIKKRWGKSDINKWKNDLRRLKIQLYQDENSNGIMDNREQRISNVKVRVQIVDAVNKTKRGNFTVDITLLTNDKGIVTFNRLPKGFYKITITPLSALQEYFFVNKSAEEIELNKNRFITIPFQKANKISGQIIIKRDRFAKNSEQNIDLTNIKIVAYNKMGNSYSTFTLSDGSFVIFAPGNRFYQLRIKNVFGKNFRITKNDIPVFLTDTTTTPIIFNIVERNRKIKFKKIKPANSDSNAPPLQQIKVLPGKIYTNSSRKEADKNRVPEFNMPLANISITKMIPKKYYIVASDGLSIDDARKIVNILYEQGIRSHIGSIDSVETYSVYLSHYDTRAEAKQKLNSYNKEVRKPFHIIRFNKKGKIEE